MATTPSPSPVPSGGAPPPAQKSNAVWWILGVAGGFLLLLIVAAVFVGAMFVRGIRVDEKSQTVQISTPAGQLTVQSTGKVRDIGLPIYPGATLEESGGSIEFTTPDEAQRVGITAARYVTADTMEKVDAWYAQRLGTAFRRCKPDTTDVSIDVQGVHVRKGDLAFVSEETGLVRVVAVKRRVSGAEIGLARIGKRETQ